MNNQNLKKQKRYVLSPIGTYGDVRPMVALGKYLISKGEEVVLVLTKDFAAKCRKHNIPIVELDVDFEGTLFRKTRKGKYKQLSSMHIVKAVNMFIDSQFAVLNSMLDENDIVLSNSFGYAAIHAAEAKNIPSCHIFYCSQLIPATDYGPFHFPVKSRNPAVNKFLWKLLLGIGNIIGRKPINRHRRLLGMSPVRETFSYHFKKKFIVATDPEIDPVSKYAMNDFSQVGYMHLFDDIPAESDFEEYLNTDKHKVYFGLGSMINNNGKKIWNILCRLSLELNIRFYVFGKGFEDIAADHHPKIKILDTTPHLRLFPKMSAVIHHGGAGTTHTAALSGVPQIIVPVLMDQPIYAKHIYRNGLGSKPLNNKRIRYKSLKGALDEVLGNEQIKNNCAVMADKLKKRRESDYAFLDRLL